MSEASTGVPARVDLEAVFRASGVGEVLDELDRTLVGLAPVKRRIREIAALLLVDKVRRELGLTAQPPTLHMCFTGNPGTGKTTVAQRMADILHRLGYIRTNRLEEGRAALEAAAALDPTGALTRSYLGRVLAAEGRREAAREQLAVAKGLDPEDPTPWLAACSATLFITSARTSSSRPRASASTAPAKRARRSVSACRTSRGSACSTR